MNDRNFASRMIKELIELRIKPVDAHLANLMLELITHVNIEAYDRGTKYGRKGDK